MEGLVKAYESEQETLREEMYGECERAAEEKYRRQEKIRLEEQAVQSASKLDAETVELMKRQEERHKKETKELKAKLAAEKEKNVRLTTENRKLQKTIAYHKSREASTSSRHPSAAASTAATTASSSTGCSEHVEYVICPPGRSSAAALRVTRIWVRCSSIPYDGLQPLRRLKSFLTVPSPLHGTSQTAASTRPPRAPSGSLAPSWWLTSSEAPTAVPWKASRVRAARTEARWRSASLAKTTPSGPTSVRS